MQPFAHALASAGKSGDWKGDLPIHEFMDLVKNACPDLRHRLVLHNADLGPALAAMAFPHRSDAREIALLHVRQDLGWLPPLAAWLERCDPKRLPRSRPIAPSDQEIVESAVRHLGLATVAPIQQVWDLLTFPVRLAPEHRPIAGALLMNSVGPILARAVLGPPRRYPRVGGGTVMVDFSWVAEGMIVVQMGSIHALEKVMAVFDGTEPRRP